MPKYVILCDTCVDLYPEQRKEFDIEYPIPGTVIFPGGKEYPSDTDWERMTFEEFFHSMEKKTVYKSAMPNPFQVKERVEEYFKQGIDVLAITLSSGMSGTYNSFLSAKRELQEIYPNRNFFIVDSHRYSGGIGLLAISASDNRKAGMSIEENYAWLEEKRLGLHQMGILDDLNYLARSGRITKFKAFMGSMVGVKPMADFDNENGYPVVLGKSRGYKQAYKNIVEYIRRTIGDPTNKTIVISQSIRAQQAEDLKKETEAAFAGNNVRVIMCRVGQSDGVNIGPGLVAAFYLGNKTSPACEEERKILEDIITAGK
ncbi:MAG: DegV family protein [Bacilli bacterium]|nr:DegV family protein [Bacilli bacterium]